MLDLDGLTKAHGAVIATSPPSRPLHTVPMSGKRHTFRDVPNDIVRAYLAEILTSHGRAGPGGGRADPLTRAESVLVDVLHERGGCAGIDVLRREVKRWSITAEALKRTLAKSPVFIRVAQGLYCLIGAPAAPRTLLSSPRWAAAI